MKKPKLLLHTCCAPCVTVPVERTRSDYEVSCFFYNPNIHPKDEYLKRLKELIKLTKELDFKIIIPDYDSKHWFELVKGLEDEPEGGKRCAVCFNMRLQEAAKYAKQNKFDSFTTTLSISPYKNSKLINQIGIEIGEQYQIAFLETDFKKKDGYRRSMELSKQHKLYRQKYCGCVFSRGIVK
jgi:predicted adenine nucleotide alpha hydrolase (AANH) superfamily ATPase